MSENPYEPPKTAELSAPTPEGRRSSWPVRWLQRNPFLMWFLFAISLYAIMWVTKPEYDDQSFGALLVLTERLWGFPIWVATKFRGELSFARSIPHHELLISFVGCFICDWIWRRVLNAMWSTKRPAD